MLRKIRNTSLKAISTSVVVVTSIELTTKLPSEGRSSELYHNFTDQVVTPFIRKVLKPEDAHNAALFFLQKGLAPTFRPNALEQASTNTGTSTSTTTSTTTVAGGIDLGVTIQTQNSNLHFPNCIGLAAGFDKDGSAIQNLMELGFGFVEIGSVTPKPQPGNPKPRMFRLLEDGGIINRFGFNSLGIDVVENNLKSFRQGGEENEGNSKNQSKNESKNDSRKNDLQDILTSSSVLFVTAFKSTWSFFFPPLPSQPRSLLGVNLGKNKLSTKETEDYEIGIERLGKYADYLVINISSPNTPGLRNLQQSEPIRRLLKAGIAKRDELPRDANGQRPPLFVKIAPDLTDDEMQDIANAVIENGIDGMLVTNTSNQRPNTLLSKNSIETGGLSGSPIRELSTECIRKMYKLTGGDVFIIGIGGVGNGRDAYEKLKAGASLVQIYSRMTYEGPGVVSRIRKELSEILRQNGQRQVVDVIGLDHADIYWEKKMARARKENEQ